MTRKKRPPMSVNRLSTPSIARPDRSRDSEHVLAHQRSLAQDADPHAVTFRQSTAQSSQNGGVFQATSTVAVRVP